MGDEEGVAESLCFAKNLDNCCAGRSTTCKYVSQDTCDYPECSDGGGEMGSRCIENKARDCCLERLCKETKSPEVDQPTCMRENVDACCEGQGFECVNDFHAKFA